MLAPARSRRCARCVAVYTGSVDHEGAEPRARARQPGRTGVDIGGLEIVAAGRACLDNHERTRTRGQEQRILPARLAEKVAVALQHPELVPLEPQVEKAVGAKIADRPDLELARPATDRWVGEAVDGPGRRGAAGQVDVLEHHDPLAQPGELGVVALDTAIDDQHAREAGEDLGIDELVQVRVVPMQALRMVVGDVHAILEALARTDIDEHVVARRLRAHVHAMKMNVGRLLAGDLDIRRADPVDQPQQHRVATTDPQSRRNVEVVVDVAGDALGGDRNLAGLGDEDGVEHTVAAADLGWIWQVGHGCRIGTAVEFGTCRTAHADRAKQ